MITLYIQSLEGPTLVYCIVQVVDLLDEMTDDYYIVPILARKFPEYRQKFTSLRSILKLNDFLIVRSLFHYLLIN